MSVLIAGLTGWLVLNGAVFAALMLRRHQPELRSRLSRWVLQNDHASRTSQVYLGWPRGNAGGRH
jgi:hypothetical protein